MRWLASLVVLCLLAAGGPRPRVEAREPRGAQLQAPDGVAPQLSARRSVAAPEQRLAPFVLAPRAPAIALVVAIAVRDATIAVARPPGVARLAHAARGPPRA
ncbi:MAG: hypothetical protein K8W52_14205 [Deltaproteobacteria bacterium]|nr:hypothetical protein [Deltaproteobacteria bacterium]